VRHLQGAGQSLLEHADGGDQIESKKSKVGQVVLAERLGLEMRMNQAKTSKARLAGADAADVRKIDPVGIADDHILHLALSVEEDSNLPVDGLRDAGEVPREVRTDDFVWRGFSPVGIPKESKLARLQAKGVAKYVRQSISSPLLERSLASALA